MVRIEVMEVVQLLFKAVTRHGWERLGGMGGRKVGWKTRS